MSIVNKAVSANKEPNIIFLCKDDLKQGNKTINNQDGFLLAPSKRNLNLVSTNQSSSSNRSNVIIKEIPKIMAPVVAQMHKANESSSSNVKGPKIHCRLCDRDITGQQCQLLYDYKENAETRLGRKFNIILNSSINYSYLSNYCCSSCTSKIQICFSLLVEIQASDEVIRQTYEHSEGAMVNTSTQTFLCEECKVTLTGIKKFIRHYESHILKKTIVGSKRDLKIMDIISVGNKKKENHDIDTINVDEDNSNLEVKSSPDRRTKSQISEPVFKVMKNPKSNNSPSKASTSFGDNLNDNNMDVSERNDYNFTENCVNDDDVENGNDKNLTENNEKIVQEGVSVKIEIDDGDNDDGVDYDDNDEFENESIDVDKVVKENELTDQDLKGDNSQEDKNDDFTIEILNDSEKEAESEPESTDSDGSYQNLIEVVKREIDKDSDGDDDDDDDDDEDEDEESNLVDDEQGTSSDGKGKYMCDTCNATFEHKFLLVHHFMKDHNWLKVFGDSKEEKDKEIEESKEDDNLLKNCNYCNENFEGPEYRIHVVICKQRFFEDREILCPDCGKMFTYKKWNNHKRHHEPMPHPDGWPCDLCGQRFKAKRFLKSHLAKHDESKKRICEICGKKLLPLSFFSHMLKHREKKHVCQHCGKAFTYQYSLRIHLKVHDSDTKIGKPMRKQKVVCWFCKKDFEGIDQLNEHLKEVHNAQGTQEDSRFPCSKCEKRFPDMFSLKAHLKLIHEIKDEDIADLKSLPVYRSIECNLCQQVFNSENKVKIHLKKVHGLKPFEMEILKKECEKCGKKFASKQNLIHHINAAHLHIKPMTCDICQEKFAKHSSLIYHKLRHSGEKPFQCEFCQKSYRQRNDVIRHLARHVRDKELTLEEASAVNNSPSPLVMKRRIFLKDSSINYHSVVRKSKKVTETVKTENVEIGEEEEPMQMEEGETVMEEGEAVQYEQEENQEEQIDFVTDEGELCKMEENVEYDDATAESMVYVEEVATDDFAQQDENIQYVTLEPMYKDNKSTIILSSPDVNSPVKNFTYRFVPPQLAVIVKKQEPL